MTSPSRTDSFVVSPPDLAALADVLAGLATELFDDAENCQAAARGLSTALDGEEGWSASATGTAWAGVWRALAERTSALAQTLAGAVQAYLDQDARIAGGIGRRREAPR